MSRIERGKSRDEVIALITEAFSGTTGVSPKVRASLHLAAVRSGVWDVVAARFPQHFGNVYELAGAQSSASVAKPSRPPEVSLEHVQRLVGKEALLRIERCDGRVECVAGSLTRATDELLGFSRFDIEATQRLAQTGDAPFVRRPQELDGFQRDFIVDLQRGDRILTAHQLPVTGPSTPAQPLKRIPIRERAKSVIAGEFTPRVDLRRPDLYVARDPETGEPHIDTNGYPVMNEEFVSALKGDLNALAFPIIHKIAEHFVAYTQDPKNITGRYNSFYSLRRFINDNIGPTLTAALDEAAADPALAKALANIERILEFKETFFFHTGVGAARDDMRLFFRSGLNTATSTIAEVGGAITTLAEGRPEVDVANTLRNSLPLIMRLAGQHLEVFVAATNVLDMSRDYAVRQHFQLVDDADGGHSLELTPAALKAMGEQRNVWLTMDVAGTTGCPAAQSLNGVNPTQTMLEAFVTLWIKHGPQRAAPDRTADV
jgi:hypothetical protein